MKSKTIVTNKKTIIAVVVAMILFFSGWFIGHNALKCKCSGDCCHQEQNMNQNK